MATTTSPPDTGPGGLRGQATDAPVIETVAGSGVVVVEDDAAWPRSAYTHALCGHLAEVDVPVMLVGTREEQLPATGARYPQRATWHSTVGAALPRRVVLQVWNLCMLVLTLSRTRANVVVRVAGVPQRFDVVFVRVLHLLHRRVVWVAHALDANDTERGLSRPARRLFRKVDVLVVLSEAHANRVRIAAPDAAPQLHVIPYGDFRFLQRLAHPGQAEARRLLGVPARLPVALCLADEADGAAADDFLVAMAELRRRGTPVGGLLAGAGAAAHHDQLLQRVAQLGLADSVQLVVGTEYDDSVDWLYAAADVVVLANRTLAEPEKALYAFAHARPVVVTDLGGFPEVVDDGIDGAVARAADPSSLAAAIMGIVMPRRRLQQIQWEIERRPAGTSPTWTEVSSRFVPLLALRQHTTGRRMTAKASGRWTGVAYLFVFWIAVIAVFQNAAGGFSIKNVAVFAAILMPVAALFLFVVPFSVKFLTYWALLFFYDVPQRAMPFAPIKFIPSLIVVAMVLHMLLEPIKDRIPLKGTRLVHVVLLLLVGWTIAECWNPNINAPISSIKMIRLIVLEPVAVYICCLAYLVSSRRIERFYRMYIPIAVICALYGLKIAFIGYFGFEAAAAGGIVGAEGRNIGTMPNPMVWGLFMMYTLLLFLAFVLERRAWKSMWLQAVFLGTIPIAAIGMLTAGQRIQFVACAVAVPIVIALCIGIRTTRTRAVVAIVLGGLCGFMLWTWIPNEATNRKDLEGKSPINATTAKLATLKNSSEDQGSFDARLENGSNTVRAVIDHPLGGGTGLLYVAPPPSSSSLGGPGTLLGNDEDKGGRARNQVPVQVGDFFFINWMAEGGVVGVILIALLFALMAAWNFWGAIRTRKPLHRAICIAGAAWGVAFIVNGITNGAFYHPTSSSFFFLLLAMPIAAVAIELKELGPIPDPHAAAPEPEIEHLPALPEPRELVRT